MTWLIPLMMLWAPLSTADLEMTNSAVLGSVPNPIALGYRTWGGGDCKAVVKGNAHYCDTSDCKAVIKGNAHYCKTSDCKAHIGLNAHYCDTKACKAIVKRNAHYCP